MKVLIATAVILAAIGTVAALECITCNSFEDPACGDEFEKDSHALQNAFTVTCLENTTATPFCRKMRMDIYETSEVRIKRDCGYMRREGYECYKKRSDDYLIKVCQCDEDLCNGAPAVSFSLAPLIALTLPIFARFL